MIFVSFGKVQSANFFYKINFENFLLIKLYIQMVKNWERGSKIHELSNTLLVTVVRARGDGWIEAAFSLENVFTWLTKKKNHEVNGCIARQSYCYHIKKCLNSTRPARHTRTKWPKIVRTPHAKFELFKGAVAYQPCGYI